MRRWPRLQASLQLVAAVLLSSLTTLIRSIATPLSCLSSVFSVVLLLSTAADNHLGTRLVGTATVVGPAWTAVLLAGGLVSAAKIAFPSDGPAYHALLGLFGTVALCLTAIARSSHQPRTQLLGSLVAVVAGLLFLLGQHAALPVFWTVEAGGILAAICAAAAAAVTVSWGVAPTLANDEMAACTAHALRNLGHAISCNYSQLLLWADEEAAAAYARHNAMAAAAAAAAAAATMDEDEEDEEDTASLKPPLSRSASAAAQLAQQQQQQLPPDGRAQQRVAARAPPPAPATAAAARRWALDLGSAAGGGFFQGSSFWASAMAWFDADQADEEQLWRKEQEKQAGEQWVEVKVDGAEAGAAAQPRAGGEAQSGKGAAAAAAAGRRASGGSSDETPGKDKRQRRRWWALRERRAREEWEQEGTGGGSAAGAGAAASPVAAPAVPQLVQSAIGGASTLSPFSAAATAAAATATSLEAAAGAAAPTAQAPAGEGSTEGAEPPPHPAPPLQTQRSLLYQDEAAEEYRARLRRSTYSFLIFDPQRAAARGGGGRGTTLLRRRRPGVDAERDGDGSGGGGGRADGWLPVSFGGAGAPPEAAAGGDGQRQLGAPSVGADSRTQLVLPRDGSALSSGSLEGWEALSVGPGASAAAFAPRVRDILPELARARALLASAQAEPAWLAAGGGGASVAYRQWEGVIDAAERLAMRCAALEGIAQEVLLMQMRLEDLQDHYARVADACALVSAQLTATLAELSSSIQTLDSTSSAAAAAARRRRRDAEAAPRGGSGSGAAKPAAVAVPEGPGWEVARQVLQVELDAALSSYWDSVCHADKETPLRVARAREVMSLLFLWTTTNALIEATEQLQSAVAAVPTTPGAPPPNTAAGPASPQPQARGSSLSGGGGSGSGAGGFVSGWRGAVSRQLAFLRPLADLLFMRPTWQHMRWVLFEALPRALRSRTDLSAAMANRKVQAGVKFVVATATVLLLILGLSATGPDGLVRRAQPIFGYVGTCMAVQERVEATADKVTLRIIGTVLGASIAQAVMSIPTVADSPFALAAALAAAAAAVGWVAVGPLRVGASLALFTFVSVVLCQYHGCCGATHPSTAYFLTRMTSVVTGCVWAAAVANLLLPSFTSTWVLDELAACLERSAALMSDLYTHQHAAMRAAAVRAGLVPHDSPPDAAPSFFGRVPAAWGGGSPGQPDGAAAAAGGGVEGAEEVEVRERALAARLRPEVVAPLLALQAALERESVSWRRGPLAAPRVARDVLAGLRVLAHAIVAQRVTLSPAPTLSPSHLEGYGYFFMGPLHQPWVDVVASVRRMAAAAAAQLRRPSAAGAEALAAEIELLETLRMRLRGAFLAVRRERHDSVRTAARSGQSGGLAAHKIAHYRDSIVFFSWQYAASRCINEITAVAHLVLRSYRRDTTRRARAAAGRGSGVAAGAWHAVRRLLASV